MFKESLNIETKEQRNYYGIYAFRGKQEDNRKNILYEAMKTIDCNFFLEVIMKSVFKEKVKLSQADEN